MKTATTNTAIIPVTADNATWSFTPASLSLDGHAFECTYSVTPKGEVYAFAKVDGVAVRVHIAKGSGIYDAALEAACKAAKQPAEAPAKQESKPAVKPAKQAAPAKAPAKAAKQPAEKPAEAPAKQESKPAAKPAKQAAPAKAPAKTAKQPEAKPEAKPVVTVGDKSWIGTTITGKGFAITFDAEAQRTRLVLDSEPTAQQRAAIDAAGFFWSPSMQSFNKGLRCKAYRAAQELAATLNALA